MESPQRRLVTIRHAPTLSAGLCVGDSDIPTTMPASVAAAHMLDRLSGLTFLQVWTSPQTRCLDPARSIAETLRIPVHSDDRLREISLGAWEGRTWDEIAASETEQYQTWLDHWLTQAPPGGETPSQLLARVEAWWKQLPPGEHLLVSHAGVTRALRVLLRGSAWIDAMVEAVPHLDIERFG